MSQEYDETRPRFDDDDFVDDDGVVGGEADTDYNEADAPLELTRISRSGVGPDPLFSLLLSGAVSIGLTPLIDNGATDMRYTLTWGILAVVGVYSWLLGEGPRIEKEKIENLAWGVSLGLILALPLVAFGGTTLGDAADLLFRDMDAGTVLAFLVFVMPLAETLFFRGLMQFNRTFWQAALIATGWGVLLFFPLMNQGPIPLIVGVVLFMANMMYGYARERNGLAAAWLCQIVVNLLVLFIPFATIL